MLSQKFNKMKARCFGRIKPADLVLMLIVVGLITGAIALGVLVVAVRN